MGFLCILGPGGVATGLCRQIVVSVAFPDQLPQLGDGLAGNGDRIGPHVGNVPVFVQALRR